MGCGSVSVRSAFSCHSAGEVFTYFPVPRYKCAHGHVRQRLCTGPGGSHDGPGNTQELHKTLPDRKCVREFSPSRTTTAVVIAVIDVVVVVAIWRRCCISAALATTLSCFKMAAVRTSHHDARMSRAITADALVVVVVVRPRRTYSRRHRWYRRRRRHRRPRNDIAIAVESRDRHLLEARTELCTQEPLGSLGRTAHHVRTWVAQQRNTRV